MASETICIRTDDEVPTQVVDASMTMEEQILDLLDDRDGTDPFEIRLMTGFNPRQISNALARLKRKGLVHGSRWRETSVWWRS